MPWNKPSVHAADHNYILGIVKVDQETEDGLEPAEEMLILCFNGLLNGWFDYNHRSELIKLSQLLWWYPIPDMPKSK
jgi:hypothetical protein